LGRKSPISEIVTALFFWEIVSDDKTTSTVESMVTGEGKNVVNVCVFSSDVEHLFLFEYIGLRHSLGLYSTNCRKCIQLSIFWFLSSTFLGGPVL
jgi:hypothetical protein